MNLDKKERDAVEKQIVEIALQKMEKGELDQYEIAKIANMVLERIDSINTEEDLHLFLIDLTARWPVFLPIEKLQEARLKEYKEDDVHRKVLELTRSGKIDEAIELSKTVTS